MKKNNMKLKKMGPAKRVSYSKIDDVLEMPNLIEIQKKSYDWFLKEGLKEIFKDVSPITDFNGNLTLEFLNFTLNEEEKPKYSIEECKIRDATYASPLRVETRLHNEETGEIKEQNIFMGDFPLMTDTGTFIINGAERVIVSQLVRSPSIYYNINRDKFGKKLISATVIPNRGSWIEYETDSNNIFNIRVDRTRKLPVTAFIRALGISTNEEIIELFGEDPKLLATLEKDISTNREEGLIEIYKKLRPGEPANAENAESLIVSMFYDPKRYDLAKVGRYKFNKKLSLANRIVDKVLTERVIDTYSGEIIAEKGTIVDLELANAIQNAGIPFVYIQTEEFPVKVLSNLSVDPKGYLEHLGINLEDFGIKGKVYYPVLSEILETYENEEELKELINNNYAQLSPKSITLEDILSSINYIMNLEYEIGNVDDIDHLGNRRIRTVGELLQNQFRIGFSRLERVVRERMATQDTSVVTPQALINIRPVTAAIKEFFGSSQLSQFMDQTNPLGELTHKRRLSALGPGGLSRDRAGFEVRDVHSSHYGRMCPIETPEGPNIGLINSLATYASINEYGFILCPYRKVKIIDGKAVVTDEIIHVTADEEENYIVTQANEPLTPEGHFVKDKVISRYRDTFLLAETTKVDLMDISPKQMVSVATALIPFLQNDDVTRALMGSNMQRQAVPLLKTDSPIIGTGMEYIIAKDTGVTVIAKNDGEVIKVSSTEIVTRDKNNIKTRYKLIKFTRSNQGTCINQTAIVNKGDMIKKGDIIADGPATSNGELALGKNPLIAFMTWEGYNYEDAILLSEKLVEDDVYTSLHIEEYETESRDTKLGPEEITRDIPSIGGNPLKNLDVRGIIRIGAEIKANDILVGKVTPKGETELTAEERLLRAIFGEKAREVRDTSLRAPHGVGGIVVDVKVFNKSNSDELAPGVNEVVCVYIAQKRKISVGDKMAGRHGNKGVISRILPEEDMPFLPNGKAVDIVLNPLGVPSRMNIGQVLEVHLGLAAKALNWKISTPVFDGAVEFDIMNTLDLADDYTNMKWAKFEKKWKEFLEPEIFTQLENDKEHRREWRGVKINKNGKILLRDGRSGEYFDNPVTVGYMHYLKLHHLVDDKIHARSTGPYSLVTQQPLGGKAQFGGQRFGEMEVWALEAYGAAYTLQEILTVKSDDIIGRVKTYEAIVKGENVPKPGIPESFKVLRKELQALSLDVRLLNKDNIEVDLSEPDQYSEEVSTLISEGNEVTKSFIRKEDLKKEDIIDEDLSLKESKKDIEIDEKDEIDNLEDALHDEVDFDLEAEENFIDE